MKIKSLSIKNFRSHKKTEINLDQINFFVGHNNSGKTSILAAVEWALTGHCMWTDKAGRGAADLVCQGQKQMAVALDVEGLGAVVRSLPSHALHVGRIVGVNEGQAAIHNHLDADESRLQVALNAGAFLAMSQAEQRTFLFSAYGLSWKVDQVATELAQWLTRKGHKEEEARRLAAKAGGYYPAGIIGGPEIFEAMEKRAKEERKELKKDKQRVESALAEINAADLNPASYNFPNGSEDIRVHLAEMQKKRDEILKASGAGQGAQARRQALGEKIGHAEKKAAEARAKAESLAAELEDLGGPGDAGFEHGTGAMDDLQEKQEKVDVANKAVATAQSKLDTIDKAGRALSGKNRKCPLAPDHIQCGLTEDQLDSIMIGLRREYKITGQELDKQQAALNEATEKLATVRKSLKESQARTKRILLLKGELNTRKHLAEAMVASLADLRKELAGLPEEDMSMHEEMAQLEATISQAEGIIAQLGETEALTRRKAVLERNVETMAAEVADLEVLVNALGPDGLRRDLLASILEGFVERVNDCLGRLTEGAYQISLTTDMTILCRANGGPLLPLKLLSKSEQLRLGIAISEALSATAGLKFLAVDEADMLDQENRDLLAGMLLDTAEELDQVLVFTTVGDVKPENPGLPGVKMFMVEEGTVREI